MLSLAFFYFVFLGTEYLFDNRMALCTNPTGVVQAQSYILGVSVLGFLAYSLIEKWKNKYENPTAFKAGGFLASGLTLVGYGLLLTRTEYGLEQAYICSLYWDIWVPWRITGRQSGCMAVSIRR